MFVYVPIGLVILSILCRVQKYLAAMPQVSSVLQERLKFDHKVIITHTPEDLICINAKFVTYLLFLR